MKQAETHHELPVSEKNGFYISVKSSRGNRLYNTRKPMRAAAVRRITQRKRAKDAPDTSDRRYRTLFERNLSGVYHSTLDGRILDCNESFAHILGYDSREDVLSVSAWNLYFSRADREAMITLLKDQSVLTNFEMMLRRKDGKPVWILGNATLIERDNSEPVIQGILVDLTERKQAEKQLKNSHEQMRALAIHLQSRLEEERTRIARELHDELGPVLTSLKIDLFSLESQLGRPAELLDKIGAMAALIDATIRRVQEISTELRPSVLDVLGLTAAIEWQLQEFQNRTGIKYQLALGSGEIILDTARSTAIFRIFQETLTNVARHANASQVTVRLKKRRGHLILAVNDNGKGITEDQINSPLSLGLIGIRERASPWAGKVSVIGIPGKGTTLSVDILLE